MTTVVYVVDDGHERVQKFNSSGAYITKWGSAGTGIGQFGGAIAIDVDADGNVYVVEIENHRVQKFTSSGVFLATWGSIGSGNGQFGRVDLKAAVPATRFGLERRTVAG